MVFPISDGMRHVCFSLKSDFLRICRGKESNFHLPLCFLYRGLPLIFPILRVFHLLPLLRSLVAGGGSDGPSLGGGSRIGEPSLLPSTPICCTTPSSRHACSNHRPPLDVPLESCGDGHAASRSLDLTVATSCAPLGEPARDLDGSRQG